MLHKGSLASRTLVSANGLGTVCRTCIYLATWRTSQFQSLTREKVHLFHRFFCLCWSGVLKCSALLWRWSVVSTGFDGDRAWKKWWARFADFEPPLVRGGTEQLGNVASCVNLIAQESWSLEGAWYFYRPITVHCPCRTVHCFCVFQFESADFCSFYHV